MVHIEQSRLAPHLPSTLSHEYLSALSPELVQKFETAFASVLRFESDPHIKQKKGQFTESDLEHVIGIQDNITDIEVNKKWLPQEIDFTVARKFGIVHDVGELITKDYPAIGAYRQTPEALRAKRLEAYCAVLILRNIPDTQRRNHAIELFHRYEKQECPESRFVKFIDSIQGNQTLIRHILNRENRGAGETESWMDIHVTLSLQKTVERSTSLKSLLSANSQKEIDAILLDNIQEYITHGFGHIANAFASEYSTKSFPRTGLIMQYEQT